MELKDLFHKQIAFFNEDLKTKDEVIDFLTSKLVKAKFIKDEKEFKDAVWKRENQDSTGIGDGIAIPHVLNPTVNSSAIAFVKLKNEIDWQSLDGKPTDLVFMIMTNGKDGNEHLEALANLSGFLVKQEIQTGLRNAKNITEVQNLLSTKIEKTDKVSADGHYDVIAITACPTGIAHTYLAAEKIEEYASNLGMSVKVETQGRRGVENKLSKADIENAKVIILAHDKAINGMARFNGVKVLDTTTKDAIYNGKDLIEKFKSNKNVKQVENAKDDSDDSVGELSLTQFKKVKDNLLAGVSRMLPFVVAGGVILGFGFLLDYIYTTVMGMTAISNISDYVTKVWGIAQAEYNEVYDYISTAGFDPQNPLALKWAEWNNLFNEFNSQAGYSTGVDEVLYYASGSFGTIWAPAHFFSGIGKVGMELMIPILAGYVCYSIVGPQGLMVGATAGLFANGNGMVYGTPGSWAGAWNRFLPENLMGLSSGFIGALAGAYLGALAVFGWTKLMKNFGKGLQGARDIVFIPVLSLLSVAIIMLAINIPLGYVMLGLQEGITFMAEKNLMFIVCTIIALMMCVDMGGPINKIAYTLGVLSVGYGLVKDPTSVAYENQTMIMSAAMAGGMIPPLGIAISTVFFPRQWTAKSKDSAKANWLMGACFISEGAIPFMIEDPKRIPVSAIIGGAIAGAIIGLMQVTITAPHGGIFVVPLTNSLLFEGASMAKAFGITGYLLAVIVGSVAMGIILGFWRLADIKSGKLVLSTSNGVKEAIESKIEKYSNNDSKLAKYNEKLNKYNKFEDDLKIKQVAYQTQMVEKAKLKEKK